MKRSKLKNYLLYFCRKIILINQDFLITVFYSINYYIHYKYIIHMIIKILANNYYLLFIM